MKVKTIVDANPLKADFEGQYEVYVIPASEPVDLTKLAEQFIERKLQFMLIETLVPRMATLVHDLGINKTSVKKSRLCLAWTKTTAQEIADAIIQAIKEGRVFK